MPQWEPLLHTRHRGCQRRKRCERAREADGERPAGNYNKTRDRIRQYHHYLLSEASTSSTASHAKRASGEAAPYLADAANASATNEDASGRAVT